MFKRSSKNLGFTLIELLVVIAIIGILSAIVLASLSSSRNKSKDARIAGEMSSLRASAELYAVDKNAYTSTIDITPVSSPTTADTFLASSKVLTDLQAMSSDVKWKVSSSGYKVIAKLTGDSSYWCIDNTGASRKTSSTEDVTSSDVCTGSTGGGGGGGGTVTQKSFIATPTGSPRNNDSRSFGFQFQVSENISVSELGRYYAEGNSESHNVILWDSNTSSQLASGVVSAGLPSDSLGFKWVSISPVTLEVGKTYDIIVDENNGGDMWLDWSDGNLNSVFINVYAALAEDNEFPQWIYQGGYGSTPAMGFTPI